MSQVSPETKTVYDDDTLPEVHCVSREEGVQLLDELAREYLGMSGEEFVRRYRADEIEDPDRTDVIRVAMAIRFAEQ